MNYEYVSENIIICKNYLPKPMLDLIKIDLLNNRGNFDLPVWSDNTKNLFSEYYRNYISDVFDSKNRLSRFTAYLPAKILLNLSLADRLEINQKSYKINSISTDMENGKSELELINNFDA